MNSVFLIVAAGRTDLKILLSTGNGTLLPAEVDLRGLRELHEWMLANPDAWTVAAPNDIPDLERDPRSAVRPPRVAFDATIDSGPPLRIEGDASVAVDSEDRLLFVAPKLGRIVSELQHQADLGRCSIQGAVVLYTQRERQHNKANDEPIAIGVALARWLAESFGLAWQSMSPTSKEGTRIGFVGAYPYLTGLEDMEGVMGGLNPAATRRLEAQLAPLAQTNPELWALLIPMGGFPAYKPYLQALAELHFQNRWHLLDDPEHAVLPRVPSTNRPAATDVDIVQARSHARRLIRQWEIQGASGAVVHLPEDRSSPWLAVLRALADLANGLNVSPTGFTAFDAALSRFWRNSFGWYRHSLTPKGSYMSHGRIDGFRFLVPALRAESALRGNRVAEALSWTYTCFDAMAIDLLEWFARQHLSNDETVRFIDLDEDTREIRFLGSPAIPEAMRGTPPRAWNWFERVEQRGTITACGYNAMFGRQSPSSAFSTIGLGAWLQQHQDWKRLYSKLQNLKDFRNLNAHSCLDARDIEQLGERCRREGIWYSPAPTAPLTLLGGPLTVHCLQTFDREDLLADIEQLIDAAEAALLGHGIPGSTIDDDQAIALAHTSLDDPQATAAGVAWEPPLNDPDGADTEPPAPSAAARSATNGPKAQERRPRGLYGRFFFDG